MRHDITVELSTRGIDEIIRALEEFPKWLEIKCEELAEKLARRGYEVAFQIMAAHVFDGDTLASLHVEKLGPAVYAVMAQSAAVLFLEFGTGTKGYGHPEPGDFGPGTYPGQTHAFDPKGWWFPTDDPRLIVKKTKDGQGWGHTYGQAPAMPMYTAVKTLEMDFQEIVSEVFTR